MSRDRGDPSRSIFVGRFHLNFARFWSKQWDPSHNPENPDDPRVEYLSWTGLTYPFGRRCGDVCEVEIRWSYDLMYAMDGDNDGIVLVASGFWGQFQGTLPADHFDEVAQLLGVTGPNFDHIEIYRMVAEEWAARGD